MLPSATYLVNVPAESAPLLSLIAAIGTNTGPVSLAATISLGLCIIKPATSDVQALPSLVGPCLCI